LRTQKRADALQALLARKRELVKRR
jgi:hypothetical protein